MKINQNTEPTESTEFVFFDHIIKVEVSNTTKGYQWRLIVDNDSSSWTNFYPGILEHKGYGLVTNYWEEVMKPWIPFKIEYCNSK